MHIVWVFFTDVCEMGVKGQIYKDIEASFIFCDFTLFIGKISEICSHIAVEIHVIGI